MKLFVYCYPKPWNSVFSPIQKVAITSWIKSFPCIITLLGDEPGTMEAAKELNVNYDLCPGKNEWNTPLVSSIFETIARLTPPDGIACYVNSDIVLGPDFAATIESVSQKTIDPLWLLVGKRRDLDLANPEKYTVDEIRNISMDKGVDHGWAGIDYFVFLPTTFQFVYPFALGKFVWDQWLVGNAFRRGIFTVDGSETILAVHLNCDWYFQGSTTNNRALIYNSDEGMRNRSFDYYQKTIISGTNYQTYYDDVTNKVSIKRKLWVPDE